MVKRQAKTLSLLFLTLLIVTCCFCGCTHKIAGNFPYSAYIDLAETENGFLVPFYEIDVRNRLCTDTGNDLSQSETVLYGGTAPLYSIVAPQGYESVEAHITACELERSSSVVDTCGYVSDGKLFGFVNVYYDTVGYLAGGGNYGVEEISHGIIFEYIPETYEFTQIKRFDNCNIVAYNGDTVLYWKSRKYYSYDLTGDTETFLVEDKAYDSGVLHQSSAKIYTNSKYTVLFMTKAKFTADVSYFYLFDYSVGELNELEIVTNG